MDNMNNVIQIINRYKVNAINIRYKSPKKSILNENVGKIFVINLLTNKTRRNYILMLMKKYNIEFTLVVVNKISDDIYQILNENKKLTKEEVGCSLSHLWVLNNIIKNKINNAIIFEDDIIFHKNFDELFLNIINKQKYDFLLLGACDFSFSSLNYKNIDDTLYRPNKNAIRVYGAHSNYYSLNGAIKMFEDSIKNIYFFDRNYHTMFNYFEKTSYICSPNLVVSDISTTNLEHSYSFLSDKEKYYYDSCFINFNFNDYNFIYLDLILKNKNIKIEDCDTFESYYKKLIKATFSDNNQREQIKKRIAMDFFSINDIKEIL
jgi:glycosyl transferase family 25